MSMSEAEKEATLKSGKHLSSMERRYRRNVGLEGWNA